MPPAATTANQLSSDWNMQGAYWLKNTDYYFTTIGIHMVGYTDSIVVEVSGLAGRIGEVFLDPRHATAWDLASQVHSNFPLPCGMVWRLTLEDALVTQKGMPILGNSAVTCVKHILSMHEQMIVV